MPPLKAARKEKSSEVKGYRSTMHKFRILVLSIFILTTTCDENGGRTVQNLPTRQDASSFFMSIPDSIQRKTDFKATIAEQDIMSIQYTNGEQDYVLLVFEGEYSKQNLRKRETYYSSQQPKSYEYFDSNGRRSGTSTVFYESGCTKDRVRYQNGLYEGISESYYPNCTLKSKTSFSGGVPNGVDSMWYENGEVKEIFVYRDGSLVDTGYVYKIDGRLKIKYVFANNELVDSIIY